mgnify:CR=1 FL=1|jgi:hypothetical protein
MPTAADAALRRPEDERTEINKSIAVSHAAYLTLVNLCPEYERDYPGRRGTPTRI